VRNFQARNFLRDLINVGDQILFYHSSIPEPAVVGLAEVVRAGYPDFTARDPNGEHFDPKDSALKPIWYMVDVRYRSPMTKIVTLENIKNNPLLADMPLVTRSRLSIQPVTADQYHTICTMGGVTLP
jgi:predicted RNA-binding protein with PUA-like domain